MALIDQILPQSLAPKQLAQLPKRFQPLYQQAYGEAYLRAAPQASGLLALLDDAKGTYQQRLAQNQAAADMISNSALSAQRNLPAQFQAPTNPLYSLLGQHAVNAAEAAKYQNTSAQNDYAATAGKISGQLSDLGNQTGAYFSTRAADLIHADRQSRSTINQQTRQIKAGFTNSEISHGINPATGKYDPALNKPPAGPSTIAKPPSNYTGSPADWNNLPRSQRDQWVAQHPTGKPSKPKPGKSPFLNPNQQVGVVAKIKGAQQGVQQLMSHPQAVPSEVATLLRSGKVDGVKYTQPQIDVAFDLYHHQGKLSSRGVRVLHGTLKTQAKGNFGILTPGDIAKQTLQKVAL